MKKIYLWMCAAVLVVGCGQGLPQVLDPVVDRLFASGPTGDGQDQVFAVSPGAGGHHAHAACRVPVRQAPDRSGPRRRYECATRSQCLRRTY